MTQISPDWRFLEPIPRTGKALVLGEEVPDLDSAFETTTSTTGRTPATGGFDLVAITGPATRQAFEEAAGALKPDVGVLVAGVGSAEDERARGWPASPRVRLLISKASGAGLEVDSVYGAVPNPWNPEYLYEIGSVGGRFAVERFMRSRGRRLPQTRRAVVRFAVPALTKGALVLFRLPRRPE